MALAVPWDSLLEHVSSCSVSFGRRGLLGELAVHLWDEHFYSRCLGARVRRVGASPMAVQLVS